MFRLVLSNIAKSKLLLLLLRCFQQLKRPVLILNAVRTGNNREWRSGNIVSGRSLYDWWGTTLYFLLLRL